MIREHFPNSFYKTSIITLIPKPDIHTRKLQTYILYVDPEILNKVLADQIQQHKKGLYTITEWDLSQKYKVAPTYKNQPT